MAGRISVKQGNLLQARDYYQKSLDISLQIGSPQNIEAALHQLGLICIDLGDYKEAHNYLEESLQFAIGVGHKREIAMTKGALGRLAKAEGNISEAIRLWSESLPDFEAIQAPQAKLVRTWLEEIEN